MRMNIYLDNKILYVTFCEYEDRDNLKLFMPFNIS